MSNLFNDNSLVFSKTDPSANGELSAMQWDVLSKVEVCLPNWS